MSFLQFVRRFLDLIWQAIAQASLVFWLVALIGMPWQQSKPASCTQTPEYVSWVSDTLAWAFFTACVAGVFAAAMRGIAAGREWSRP